MRVITQLPNDDLRHAQSVARSAEAAGFDGVVAALENAHSPYLPLAVSALATERIQLGTAVAMAFPRSPTITAHQAWDIHKASGGRFYLGLGSQVKAHNERRYGIAWSPPAPRMRDYIGAVRAIWRCWEREEPLAFHSEHYTLTLMTPNFSPRPTGLRVLSRAAIGCRCCGSRGSLRRCGAPPAPPVPRGGRPGER
jgi:probable F420-dependent oxidoreductase